MDQEGKKTLLEVNVAAQCSYTDIHLFNRNQREGE